MDEGHLTRSFLTRLAAEGPPSLPLLARVLAHLRAVCPDCREALASLAEGRAEGPPKRTRHPSDPTAMELCALLRRQFGAALPPPGPSGEEDEDGASRAVALLLETPDVGREKLLGAQPSLFTLAAWANLVRGCRVEFAAGDPRAEGRAALAKAVAERLDEGRYGPGVVADCRGVATAAVAGARAQAGSLVDVHEALEKADAFLEQGSGDPYADAEVGLEEAAVAVAEGRLQHAVALLGRAGRRYAQVRDRHMEAVAQVLQARLWEEMGNPGAAAAVLARAWPQLDRQRAPALARLADQAVSRLLPRLILAEEEG